MRFCHVKLTTTNKAEFVVVLSFIIAVEKLADELRDADWKRFVDAADIRRDSQKNHLLFQELKAAWILAHPISPYVVTAIAELEKPV